LGGLVVSEHDSLDRSHRPAKAAQRIGLETRVPVHPFSDEGMGKLQEQGSSPAD
jgi:hypothetical protein